MKKLLSVLFAVIVFITSADAQKKRKSRSNSNFKEFSEWYSNDIGKRILSKVKLFEMTGTYGLSISSIQYDREQLPLLQDVYRIGDNITDALPSIVRPYISDVELPRLTGIAKRKSSKWSIRTSARTELPLIYADLTLWDGRLSNGKFWLQPKNLKGLFNLTELGTLLLEETLTSSKLDVSADLRVGIKPLELFFGFHKPRIELTDQFYVGGDIHLYKTWSLDLTYKAGTELFDNQASLEPWLDEQIPDWIQSQVDVGRLADALVEGVVGRTPSYVFGLPVLKGWGGTLLLEAGFENVLFFKNLRFFVTIDQSQLSNSNIGSPKVKHFLLHVGMTAKVVLGDDE